MEASRRVPDKFPDGCEFFANFSGDDFVKFPDGKVFRLADDGVTLKPESGLPRSGAPSSEAQFLGAAESCRVFTEGGMEALKKRWSKGA